MAEYNINFSTNATKAAQEINRVHKELTAVIQVGKSIKLNLDTSSLSRNINISFRRLNKEIEKIERRLSKLQVGSGAFRSAAASLGYREGQRERGELIAQPLRLRGQAQAFEQGSNVRLQKELRALQVEASQIAPNTIEWVKFQQEIAKVSLQLQKADKLADDIQLRESLGAFAPQSLAQMEVKLTILKNKAREIAPDSKEWRQANKEIQELEKGIQKVNRKPLSAGQRAGAAGGTFLYGGGLGGGVGSAVGGIAGGLAGGVPGAFAGAAVGQIADNLGMALAGITSQAAAVQKMQRGLAMASVDAKDFAEAQAAVGEMSQKLLMPLEQTTKYFAQLRANTKEYNLSVAETRQILEGTALAIMATGGSAEDLDGAMRAVVQIMSKGGVQAEELRGQLGERFPGAVVKFAQANKMSFEELQAGLEEGKIGIREFINFAKKNYTDYAKFSEQLATAPEYAGQRLAIAFEEMQRAIGSAFGSSGATIQDTITGWLKDITRFVTENREAIQQMASDFSYIFKGIVSIVRGASFLIREALMPVVKFIQNLIRDIRIAVNSAGAAQYESKINSIDAEIAAAEKTVDVRALGRIAELRKQRGEMERLFKGAGGQAALDGGQPSNLTYGGAGAGMSIDRQLDDEKKKKADNLESFERLRDQLANTYNQAEIERIKTRHELEKRLQEDLHDMQEFGANRLQRQNLQFLRGLVKAERDRQGAILDAKLNIAAKAGKVVPGAPLLPPARGGGSAASLTSFTSQQLARATQDASRFTGIANMCSESVKAFYKSLGISLPGVTGWADTVRKAGQTMTDWSQLRAGDIVATGRPGDTPHVGVYTGGQNVFHQSRSRGLRAGNYPDLSYFQQQGYFVRPAAGTGAPRKVGSNESRDAMAAAETQIAEQNAVIAERGALLTKESAVLKELGRYMQEVYNVPDLELDNQLLKARNDLMEQGVDPNVIDHKMRLLELDIQYQHLLKAFPGFADDAKLSEEGRIKILAILAGALNNSMAAEKAKNDEILRGTYIQERKRIADELAMAKSLTPDQELRTQIAQEGYTGKKAESLFQERKALQGAQKLKEDMQGIASSIGNSFGEAFKGIITGSMTAQEALAGMFQSIADHFADMVAQMIAEWLKAQLIQGFMNIFSSLIPGVGSLGGGGSVLGGNSSAVFGINSADMNQYAPLLPMANGGVLSGGFRAFANGGIVTGPTLGLVGEGRYNEAVIPLPDGRSVPVELSGGGSSSPTVIVNVDAKGSQVEGDEQNANQLGRVISAAVQTELIKQQRPGGLLASRR